MEKGVEAVRHPGRFPWIIVVVLVVIGLGILIRYCWRGWKALRCCPGVESVCTTNEVMASSNAVARVGVAVVSNAVAVVPAAEPVVAATNGAEVVPLPGDTNAVGVLAGEAEAARKAGRLVDARLKWLQILESPVSDVVRLKVEEQLGMVNAQLVLTSAGMPEKTEYVVSAGDSLDKLAKRYKTTIDLLQKGSNTADPSLIKVGDRLRILEGSFFIEVSRSRRDLLLLFNEKFFKRYTVGIGKEGKTPVGSFEVAERIKDPVWWRADGKAIPFGNPENILGTRWMSIRAVGETAYIKGYGIHGTWDNASVGKSESAGCVRMRNADVEELFIMVPIGTPVTIRE